MPNLNRVFLMGHLTRDPELEYSDSGKAVATFGLAVSRNWTTESGEKKEDVCFVDCVAFGKRGEAVAEYFQKGSPIFLEGRLNFRQWETQDGQKRSALNVVVENFQFIGQTGKGKDKQTPATSNDVPDEF